MVDLFGGTGNPEGPVWRESRGAPCRQGAGGVASLPCPRETAAEKEVSELLPQGNRRYAETEVEKGGAVVSPPSVERGEGQRADGQMTARRRGSGRRSRARKGVWVSGVTADTKKKEPPAVALSKPDASVDRVGSRACV
jgi:hypothetical protein